MKELEIRGPTSKDAIKEIQLKYAAYEDEIEAEILEEGSKGFLGLFGSKEATVKVRILPKYFERKVREFLTGIIGEFDSNVLYDVQLSGRTFKITVDGDQMSRLIGRHGKTVAALQHIMNIYANRLSDVKVNVRVDVGDYRTERKDLVQELAHRTAKAVLKKREKVTMQPMFAFERRLVHEVISQYQELRSYSVGLEPYRRVVVEYTTRQSRPGNRTYRSNDRRPSSNNSGNGRSYDRRSSSGNGSSNTAKSRSNGRFENSGRKYSGKESA